MGPVDDAGWLNIVAIVIAKFQSLLIATYNQDWKLFCR